MDLSQDRLRDDEVKAEVKETAEHRTCSKSNLELSTFETYRL